MAFCENCGAELPAGSKFCTKCGTPAAVPPVNDASSVNDTTPVNDVPPVNDGTYNQNQYNQSTQNSYGQNPYNQSTQNQYQYEQNQYNQNQYNQYNQTVQNPYIQQDEDVRKNKGMAVLCYFGIFLLIPLFSRKNSKFCRFHANQGLILLIYEVIVNVLSRIINMIFSNMLWPNDVLVFCVSAIIVILGLFGTILSIIGIVHAAKGEYKEIPVLGKIQLLK